MKWTEADISYLKKYYGKKLVVDMTRDLSRSAATITKKASVLKLKSKLPNKFNKKSCDDNYFAGSSLQSCYWAGFLAADGCIIQSGNHKVLFLGLSVKDENHIKLFCRHINFSGSVYKNKNYRTIKISSDKLCSDLQNKFNLTPRKTKTLKPPKLTGQKALAFIIGYIDGDGSIFTTKTNHIGFNVVGTAAMMNWIRNTLNRQLAADIKTVYKEGSLCKIMLSKNKCLRVLKKLDKVKVSKLSRKWEKLGGICAK